MCVCVCVCANVCVCKRVCACKRETVYVGGERTGGKRGEGRNIDRLPPAKCSVPLGVGDTSHHEAPTTNLWKCKHQADKEQ